MATLGTDKQWWPTREPPTRQPDEVDMDTTRRGDAPERQPAAAVSRRAVRGGVPGGCLPRQESARQPGHVHPGDRSRENASTCSSGCSTGTAARGNTPRRSPPPPSRASSTAPTRSRARVARRSIRARVPRRARHRVRPRVRRHRPRRPEEPRRRVQEQRHHRRRGAHRARHAPHGQRGTREPSWAPLATGEDGNAGAWDIVEVTHDQTCFRRDERERMRKEAKSPCSSRRWA